MTSNVAIATLLAVLALYILLDSFISSYNELCNDQYSRPKVVVIPLFGDALIND